MAQYTMEDVKAQIKPLSDNAFVAFFQKIWRAWLGLWYGFADKHPKLAKLIYQIFFFIVFSEGVTIYQYVVMTFLPFAFGYDPNNYTAWGWAPFEIMGVPCTLFGDAKGFETFLAYQISGLTAQCINFPLQRNITYKSKGNPWWQAMWYFIGYVLVNLVAMSLIWGVCNCFLIAWNIPDAIIGLVKTVLTGGVAMAVFFVIFLIIFPDLEKMAAKEEKKVEALKAANAPAEKIAEAEAKAESVRAQANLDAARRNEISANTIANTKALSWEASVRLLETMKADSAKYTAEQVEAQEKVVEEKYQQALEATENKYAAVEAYAALKA